MPDDPRDKIEPPGVCYEHCLRLYFCPLRHLSRENRSPKQPLVGIAVDAVTGYGRAVMRGAMRYANVQRCWLIHEELRRVYNKKMNWPRCDGAIVAGAAREMIQHIIKRSRHTVQCTGSGDPNDAPVVCLDDVAAGAMAAEHLMNCRLEHFGYFAQTDALASINRGRGFMEAVTKR